MTRLSPIFVLPSNQTFLTDRSITVQAVKGSVGFHQISIMSLLSISNTENELHFFITRLQINGILQTAEIHEVDMSGWTLFECFLHPAQTVVYISWDEETSTPEWIEMEDDVTAEFATLLTGAITNFKSKTKAA